MPYRAAAFPNVTAFSVGAFALRDYRRTLLGGVSLGLGALAAVAVTGGAATMAAAWLLSSSLSSNPHLQPAGPVALEAAAMPRPHRSLADAANLVVATNELPRPRYAQSLTVEAELAAAASAVAAAPKIAPMKATATNVAQLPPKRVAEQAKEIPLPSSRPPDAPQMQTKPEMARASTMPPPRLAAVAAPPPEPVPVPAPAPTAPAVPAEPARPSVSDFFKRFTPQLAYNNPDVRPAPDSRTAVYDIEAHTVYMPDGQRLEAHSGLGNRMDDPRFVGDRGKGATPPNVYDLTLRGERFHGVQAIRLNPVSENKMYGRAGILAHTYMLGPSGQSFGCVSFRDYQKFLEAFLRGEVTRLVVVPHYESRPTDFRARREDDKRLAFNKQ
jgi:hypothetical protein